MILFFRGKAATGKSLVANAIAEKHSFKVMSKDSVFDELLENGYDWDVATEMAYDELALKIQQNNDAEREVFISGVAELMRANLMWG